MKYEQLSQHPKVFYKTTGLTRSEFDDLFDDILPNYVEAEQARLQRPDRERDIGAGHPFEMEMRDHMLMTVIWLRLYPIHEVLGYLFGVSDSTVSRTIKRVLPVLEQAGRDTMRMPDPGRKKRRQLDELLQNIPELSIIVDTFEQRVQRSRDQQEADAHYSGKKKQHTLKSQVAIDAQTGCIVDVAASVPGPKADIKVLAESQLLNRLPAGVAAAGDLAYVGIGQLHPEGLGFSPRRKPRGKDRPAEDVIYNTAFSRFRLLVEHTIGRMRRYQSISQTDRNHRQQHTPRVIAIAGLVNRYIRYRMAT
jgi:hypothetical protein